MARSGTTKMITKVLSVQVVRVKTLNDLPTLHKARRFSRLTALLDTNAAIMGRKNISATAVSPKILKKIMSGKKNQSRAQCNATRTTAIRALFDRIC